MNRRQAIAAVGSAGLLPLTGCASVVPGTTLSDPTEERETDGETHLIYTRDGERLATLTVQPGRQRYAGSAGGQIPVDVSVWHRDRTKIERLTLGLRAPPGGPGVPARVALLTPQWKPHPSVQLYTDRRDGETVLGIDDTGEQGDGTVTFEFLLAGLEASTSELLVDAAVGLAEQGVLGRAYTLEGRTRVPLPDGDDAS